MKISFCTTCFNRARQLMEVFDRNTELVAENPNLEWIIVNFNSTDGMDALIMKRLRLMPPNIVYVRDNYRKPWNVSRAKNVAHRLASHEILMNLDCDNLIGNSTEVINEKFNGECDLLHQFSQGDGAGTFGRIALTNNLFYALGGYDESFDPMGYQDIDLIERANRYGAKIVHEECPQSYAVKNKRDQGWDQFNYNNMQKSAANINAGRYIANTRMAWDALDVKKFPGFRRR